jgi:hypothetical protein
VIDLDKEGLERAARAVARYDMSVRAHTTQEMEDRGVAEAAIRAYFDGPLGPLAPQAETPGLNPSPQPLPEDVVELMEAASYATDHLRHLKTMSGQAAYARLHTILSKLEAGKVG